MEGGEEEDLAGHEMGKSAEAWLLASNLTPTCARRKES